MFFLPIPNLSNSDFVRFWSKVTISTKDKCWNWTGACHGNIDDRRHRPIFKIQYVNYIAARVAWKSFYKEDPSDLLVCHSCSPPTPMARQLCVNPSHLWLGTYSENLADAARKGEAPTKNRSRLLEQDIINIRKRVNSGESPSSIGESYGLSRNTIWRISTRRSFPEIV